MRLPKHPFPVQTCFRDCHLVNFAIDPAALARVLPAPLVPDVYADRAWLSVVIAQVSAMRPVGVPELLGITHNQVVYRAVIRHDNARGAHFLRSDTDSHVMSALGNAMSFFAFHHADIALQHQGDVQTVEVHSRDHTADIRARFRHDRDSLGSSSRPLYLDTTADADTHGECCVHSAMAPRPEAASSTRTAFCGSGRRAGHPASRPALW